ncbi:hypothetical protein FJZ19_02585 [Candidatus Pacearchaeota archaeon]|nr:hypothetical protein [Candidatus Pacearchaeota archaeon]
MIVFYRYKITSTREGDEVKTEYEYELVRQKVKYNAPTSEKERQLVRSIEELLKSHGLKKAKTIVEISS